LYDKGQFGLKPNLPRRWTAEEEAFEEMLDHERYMALDKDMREEDFRKGVYMSVCRVTRVYVCVHAHVCVRMCVCVCAHVHVCVCMRVHACDIKHA